MTMYGKEWRKRVTCVQDISMINAWMDGAVRTTASMPPAAPKLCPIMDLMDDTFSLYA
jgi:hypothetical protein